MRAPHLAAIVCADHSAISGLRERFPNYEINWEKQVANRLGNNADPNIFYYRVAGYGLKWEFNDTAARKLPAHAYIREICTHMWWSYTRVFELTTFTA